jgi:hypothetical protein
MKLTILILISLSLIGFVSASTNGTFIGNETITVESASAEFDVVADIGATQWWAEVWLNTSEIDFGHVTPGADSNLYRQKYKIRARGNVNINILPTLLDGSDKIFSNLYFSRTFSSGWERVGSYDIRFNLTENEGWWTVIGASGLENMTNSNGEQSIKLDLSDHNDTIPFTIDNYRNTVKFVVVPDWTSV